MKSQLLSVVVSTIASVIIVVNLRDRGPPPDAFLHEQCDEFHDAVSSTNSTFGLPPKDNLYDVQNTTLGFEEVHMISLPLRGDKQDSFAIQAGYSGFTYNLVDGVDGRRIPNKALPYTMDQDDATIGCWRAHLNIFRDMVERNTSSALIFEDDADWDVALKSQLVQFARGSRFLTNTSEGVIPHSPYGDDWDLLWLGNVGVEDKSPFIGKDLFDNRRFVIPKDPTVLPPERRTERPQPDMSHWEAGPDGDNSTRIVLVSAWSLNTAAYAISQRGAKKLLYLMSLMPYNDPIDQAMGHFCKWKALDMVCIAPFPALIGVSKPPGGMGRWSDMDHVEDGQKDFVDDDTGFSLRVRFSVRQNMDRLLVDKKVFKAADGVEMHIDDITAAVGHVQLLDMPPPVKLEGPPDTVVMRVEDFTPLNQG